MSRYLNIAIGVSIVIIGVAAVLSFWPSGDAPLPEGELAENSTETQEDELGSTLNDPAADPGMVSEEDYVPDDNYVDEGLQTPTPGYSPEIFELGDRLLLGGNFKGAYKTYEQLIDSPGTGSHLQIRLGAAAEFAGDVLTARTHYTEVAESNDSSTARQLQGLLGLARIWEAQQRYDVSAELLSDLFLSYVFTKSPEEIKSAISNQLSRCLQKRILAEFPAAQPSATWNPDLLEYSWMTDQLEQIISSEIAIPKKLSSAPLSTLQVVQNPGLDPDLILVNANCVGLATNQILNELESQTSLSLRLSDEARATLAGRATTIRARGIPLSLLLDQTLTRNELIWVRQNDTIEILHSKESKQQPLSRFNIARLDRLYGQMQFLTEDEGQRAALLLNKANNAILTGDLKRGQADLTQSLSLRPMGELAAALYFNAGHLALADNKPNVALERFYQALDQSLLPRMQAKSFNMIASLELQRGEAEKAITAASRSLKITDDADEAQQSLITLAKAYIIAENPLSAIRVLHANADSIKDIDARRLASIYASYSRYQITKPQTGLQNEGERLVVALAAMQPTDPRTFVDHLIISRAFQAVGFHSKSLEHLATSADSATGAFWPQRINIALVEMMVESGRDKEAYDALQRIPTTNIPELEQRRLLESARLAIRMGDNARCVSTCRSLLETEATMESKREALSILGSAYRSLNRPYAAALCFAGMLPDEASSNGVVQGQ